MIKIIKSLFIALLSGFLFNKVNKSSSFYRLKTSINGINNLLNIPKKNIDDCIIAYEYMVNGTAEISNGTSKGTTKVETNHVKNYYSVVNEILAVADIEKMYIPPQIDPKFGLFNNQLILEKNLFNTLQVDSNSKILDIGCGRGRIAHHAAKTTGSKVYGFNIDESQIKNAIKYSKQTNMEKYLDFKVGDHHDKFMYPNNSFNASYSFQAVWPFFKKKELDSVSKEIFRVLVPGGIYSCSEYLLTPYFDKINKNHMKLHSLFLPTLAATQSNYPKDVIKSLKKAGFNIILSAPSIAPAWPLTNQKTDFFLLLRSTSIKLNKLSLIPDSIIILINNLLKGGKAWSVAEKMKIADLNWRIIVQKPY